MIPRSAFTDPEVATVGLTAAAAQQIPVGVTRFPLHELDRAIVESTDHAGVLLAEVVLAMRWKLGLSRIFSTVHAYPTYTEANKHATGVWKKTRAPQRLLGWLERWFRWRRGGG